MRFRFVLWGLGLPLAAWAVPPEVMELQESLAGAQAKLAAVQDKIDAVRGRHKAEDARLRETVRDMARVGQYPDGFWLMRSVMLDTPGQVELMRVLARQQGRALVQAQAEAGQLAALYGEANRQIQSLRDVEAAYGDAQGRLLEAEKVVLRRAGIQAGALSDDLEAALKGEVQGVAPRPVEAKGKMLEGQAAGGLPVAGRVERGFGQGEGAAKAGVVLRAATGAEVKATQAARVLYAGPFRHFGGLVIVKTVRGEDVLLGGMGSLSVRAGEDVAVGDVLGRVGDEGRLYWEVRRRGRVVSPL